MIEYGKLPIFSQLRIILTALPFCKSNLQLFTVLLPKTVFRTYLYYTPNFTGLLLPGHGQRQAHHFRCAGLLQHPGTLVQRGAGGADIIHQKKPLSGKLLR